MLLFGALVPHAAIIIREIGGAETDKVAKTAEAMQRLAGIFKDLSPETVVVFSPMGRLWKGSYRLEGEESLEGNLRQFGSRLSWTFQNDRELVDLIIAEVEAEGLSATVVKGIHIPPLGCIGVGPRRCRSPFLPGGDPLPFGGHRHLLFLPPERQYALGVAIGRALRKTSKRVAVVASGDLSHCLIPGAPVAYNPRGRNLISSSSSYSRRTG